MPATPAPVATTAPAPTLNRGLMGATSPAPAPQVCSAWGHPPVCLSLHPSPHQGLFGLKKNPEFLGSPGVLLLSVEILFGSTTDLKTFCFGAHLFQV